MKLYKIFLFLTVFLAMMSCDTIIDLEDPLKANITLTTDWTNRTDGIDIPSPYTVKISNQTLTFNNITNFLPELDAGTYPIFIYNTPEDITINGTTASVATTGSTVAAQPGWLFTSITQAEYVDFKVETIIAVMTQQVRQLSFELHVTGGTADNLQSVTASLTGVANAMDFMTDTYSGTGLNVIPVLTTEGDKLTGSVRLIGITTEAQILTLDIIYTDGKQQTIVSDISDKLAAFNSDKHRTMTLSAIMEITNQAGFEATINEWQTTQASGGVAW